MADTERRSRFAVVAPPLIGVAVLAVLCTLYARGAGPFAPTHTPKINPKAGDPDPAREKNTKARARPLTIRITPEGLRAGGRPVRLDVLMQMARFVPAGEGPAVRIESAPGVDPRAAEALRGELAKSGVIEVSIPGEETPPKPATPVSRP